jgi:hypothetical protein
MSIAVTDCRAHARRVVCATRCAEQPFAEATVSIRNVRAAAKLRRQASVDGAQPASAAAADTWLAVPLLRQVDAHYEHMLHGAAPGSLEVGPATDPEEARADLVAESVMRRLARGGVGDPGGDVDSAVRASSSRPALRRSISAQAFAPVVGREGGPLSSDISDEITSRRGGGSPIPAPLRRTMEGAFGRDLGDVRLHTDEHAARLSAQVSAKAFTVGQDIFFGAGEYRPDTTGGQHTLAHELAHTGAPIGEAAGAARRLAVHRTIARGSKEIRAVRGMTGALTRKLTGTRDRLDVIGRAVDDYNTARNPDTIHTMLHTIMLLCQQYLKENGAEGSGPGDRKSSIVHDILAEAQRDLTRIEAQERYLDDARSLTSKTRLTQQKQPKTAHGLVQEKYAEGMKMVGTAAADQPLAEPGAEVVSLVEKVKRLNDELPRVIAKYGITEAEAAAIRTYTLADYRYINPTVANDQKWLDKANGFGNEGLRMNRKQRAAAEKERFDPLRAEGPLHAGVMMPGLAKLPVKKGRVYRGEVLTEKLLQERTKTGEIVNNAFWSASLKRGTGEGFGSLKPGEIRVLFVLTVNNARDVRHFSDLPEDEWLILPGARFAIKSIEDEPPKTAGRPGRKIVTAVQTR